MMKFKSILVIGLFLLCFSLALVACTNSEPTACPDCPKPAPCPTTVVRPDLSICPEPVVADVPYEAAWSSSGHADGSAEAFRHWDGEDPQTVPTGCAKCHAPSGFMDFIGADGTEAGFVDTAHPVSNGITCLACHNEAATLHTSVIFPSGVEISGLGSEAACMECHQGRASKISVDRTLIMFNALEDLDSVPAPVMDGETERKLGFINVHYYPAAATLYGSQTMGGYQYDRKTYDIKNGHVPGYDTCAGCHDTHSLEVKIDECAICHEGIRTAADLKNIRMISSNMDYDGDGSQTEGISGEISGLQEILYQTIQAYASEITGTGIVYDAHTYPYFLVDADGDGVGDKTESGSSIAFPAWTGRLLKAAYNYQVSIKDPGAFAHGNKYIIQLLYDSIEDLNTKLTSPLDMTMMSRDDTGHFAGSADAFRHWDEAGYDVPSACAKCHTARGLPEFLDNSAARVIDENGSVVIIGLSNLPASNGFNCRTCHDPQAWPDRYSIASVDFPSGISLSLGGIDTDNLYVVDDSNICLHCHQGNESSLSVQTALMGKEEDVIDPSIRFKNIHFSAAGATLFGSQAAGAYQYPDKEYAGLNDHPDNKCIECHDAHTLKVNTSRCISCHVGVSEISAIRMYTIDFDGDGDVAESIAGEITTLQSLLLAEIEKYAETITGTPIVYNGKANPYFFVDADQDGIADVDWRGAFVRYNAFTPRLMRAAYNYQFSQKDPAGYVHNPNYVIQILIDSIADLGGDVTVFTRP